MFIFSYQGYGQPPPPGYGPPPPQGYAPPPQGYAPPPQGYAPPAANVPVNVPPGLDALLHVRLLKIVLAYSSWNAVFNIVYTKMSHFNIDHYYIGLLKAGHKPFWLKDIIA